MEQAGREAGDLIMEIWDAYTRDGKKTGRTLVRGEPIPDGLYHLVCEALVYHADGSVLAMRRSMDKPNYPGWYETTAGGSALTGEDALACIRREVCEETGLLCDRFEEVGRCVNDSNHTIFHSFICTVSGDKDAVRLQAGETEGYLWMSREAFCAFAASDRMIPSQKKRLTAYFLREGILKEA